MPLGLRSLFDKPQIVIVNYYAFISNNILHIRGRVLEDDKIVSLPSDNWIRNFRNFVKRMLTNEVPNAELQVSYGVTQKKIIANTEGFYEGTFDIGDINPTQIRIEINQSSLPSNYNLDIQKTVSTTQIDSTVKYGIISDIDDTILVTGVVSWLKWRLLLNTLFRNPQNRKSFKNAATFYTKLTTPNNPIFYISNSPWNLFDYLKTYLDQQGFPKGYIRLRDFNIFSPKLHILEKQNKYKEIIKAFQACPDLGFILIGDAGEVDTDIYLNIADKHPDRVKAIYIRSVKSKKRMRRIREIAIDYTTVPILIFDHTIEMENHARDMGLVEQIALTS